MLDGAGDPARRRAPTWSSRRTPTPIAWGWPCPRPAPPRRRGRHRRRLAGRYRQRDRLLADHLLRHSEGADRLVVATVVSSRLVERLAEAAGVHYAATLTGFKWIVRPALAHPDWRFLFGYEEALASRCSPAVRDKDGISPRCCGADRRARTAGTSPLERWGSWRSSTACTPPTSGRSASRTGQRAGPPPPLMARSGPDRRTASAGGASPRSATATGATCRRPRGHLGLRRPHPGGVPPERHRAEAQDLPELIGQAQAGAAGCRPPAWRQCALGALRAELAELLDLPAPRRGGAALSP